MIKEGDKWEQKLKDDGYDVVEEAKKGKVKIPKSVQNIADYAFYGCNQITEIITHKNIKNIEKNSFTDCNAKISKL